MKSRALSDLIPIMPPVYPERKWRKERMHRTEKPNARSITRARNARTGEDFK
jgi:hypothetical protein